MKALGAVSLAALFGAAGAVAQGAEGWLPPRVEKGAVEQLAGRMAGLEAEPGDAGRRLEGARVVIGALRETLEGWGETGVLERAPAFPGLGLPEPSGRHLDAMVRYHVCNLVLALQLQNPELAGDADARVSAVLGLSAVTLAVVYLREPYLRAGGSDEEMGSLLGGEPLEPVFERLQTEEPLLRLAERQCQPVVVALLERSVERLGELRGAGE